jgi:hypothetical protein
MEEDLHETLDGHEFVIYTTQAQAVCVVSRNDGEYEEQFGEAPPSPEVQALYAMRADVYHSLSYLGIDDALAEVEDDTDDTDDAEENAAG